MFSWEEFLRLRRFKVYWRHFWTNRFAQECPMIDIATTVMSEQEWSVYFEPIFDRWVDIIEGTFADFC